jgi:G:T-mismatch repair DNA endonuclease (very short patch repair protein)
LSDVGLNVDIYIPSQKKVIELYGDYWHCNPEKYNGDYYHKQLHMTAKEKWIADRERQQKLEDAGYKVEIV